MIICLQRNIKAKLAKKQKIEIKFEREDCIASLRRAIDIIDDKCTVYIVEKQYIISRHDYIAN